MQDTSGVDAHMAPVAIHTVMACYPLWPLAVAHGPAQPSAPHGPAPTWRGATPQAEGLVRARARRVFTRWPPPFRGRSPPDIPSGKATERR